MGSAAASLSRLVGARRSRSALSSAAAWRGGEAKRDGDDAGRRRHCDGAEIRRPRRSRRSTPDGAFSGYASLFGRVDLRQDLVERGRLRAPRCAARRGGHPHALPARPGQPIGVWTRHRRRTRAGCSSRAGWPAVGRAREVLALMRGGALDGLSIGFRTVKARRDRRPAFAACWRATSGRSRSSPFRCCPRPASPR